MIQSLPRVITELRRPPSGPILRLVALLTVPLLLASVGYKRAKALSALPTVGWAELAPLLSADLLFAGLWAACWAWALHLLAGRARQALTGAMHACAALVLVYAVVEHRFLASTGTLLDWDMLRYSATQLDQVRRIAVSETDLSAALSLLGALGLALWPLAVPSLRLPAARASADPRGWRAPSVVAACALIVGLLATAMALRAGPPRDKLLRLRANPSLALLGGAWDSLSAEWRLSLAPVEVKPFEPLVLAQSPRTRKLNVVVIALESERAISMTPYTPTLDTMPFLASFAKKGVVVEQAYTVIPQTTKALVPIHCGIYPKIAQEVIEPSPNALPSDCLASLLRRHGYATGYVQAAESIFERGAELVKAFGFDTLKDRDNMPTEGFEASSYFGYEDDVMIGPALQWVDQQKQPFFLGMLTLVSHHFYQVPASLPKKFYTDDPKLNDYLNTLRYEDRFLQKLIAGFEARGLMDSTLFVIVADHGQAFGEHGLFQHGSTYHEEGIKVPMILVGPGLEKLPRRLGGLRQQLDIMPTILDVLGFDIVAGSLPGRSLFDPRGHDRLFHACWRNKDCLAMREGRFKTVFRYDKGGPEVFDLVADPGEKVNLVATGQVTAAEVDRRLAQMQAWRDGVNARYDAQARRRTRSYVSRRRPEPQHAADVVFGNFARLVGYDLERTRTVSGEPNWVTFYFEVLRDPKPGWELFVHVDGPGDELINVDHVPVEGSYPIADWKQGEFIADRTWLRVKPQKPSGPYDIFIGMYQPDNGDRRAALSPGQEGPGAVEIASLDRVLVATVDIDNPRLPYVALPAHGRERIPPGQRHLVQRQPTRPRGEALDVTFGGAVKLRSLELSASSVELGQPVTLTWYIEALEDGARWNDMFVHLVGPENAYHNAVHTPVLGTYPVANWARGDFIRDPQTVVLPAQLAPGTYKVWVGFWNPGLTTPLRRLVPSAGPGRVVAEGRLLAATLQVRAPSAAQHPRPTP